MAMSLVVVAAKGAMVVVLARSEEAVAIEPVIAVSVVVAVVAFKVAALKVGIEVVGRVVARVVE